MHSAYKFFIVLSKAFFGPGIYGVAQFSFTTQKTVNSYNLFCCKNLPFFISAISQTIFSQLHICKLSCFKLPRQIFP
jgi:hypothetical protein